MPKVLSFWFGDVGEDIKTRNDFHLNDGKLSVGSISDTGDRTQLRCRQTLQKYENLKVQKFRHKIRKRCKLGKNMKILNCKSFAAKHITTRTSWDMGMLHNLSCMSCPETGGLKPLYLTCGYACK